MSTIPTNQNFPTSKQIPDHSIMDHFNKQTYLGNQFIFSASVSLTGTSEVPLFLLTNGSTTKSLFQNILKLSCITAAGTCVLKTYYAPTVTGAGTAKTPINLRPANANTSVATLAQAPTVSANGSLIDFISCNAFAQASSDLLSVLDPGQIMLVTAIPSGSITVLAELGFYEL